MGSKNDYTVLEAEFFNLTMIFKSRRSALNWTTFITCNILMISFKFNWIICVLGKISVYVVRVILVDFK